jgi:alpha-ketoglutarate-dependent taurine dioxygenase
VPRLTSAQIELLDLIDTIANDPAYYLSLDFEPGDMQFLKNAAILHARTEYEDWPEPAKKRHLLRLWLTN